MSKSVIVITPKDKDGNILPLVNKYANSTKGIGYITVQQEVVTFDKGFRKTSLRTARIRGEFNDLVNTYKRSGEILEGRIVRFESFDPFMEGQTPKMNPETKELVKKNGKPVYMMYQYSDNETHKDEWIESEVEETVSVSDDLAKQ